MTDFSRLRANEAKPNRPKQAKFYLSDLAHTTLTRAAIEMRLSMSALVDTMILQELAKHKPPRPARPDKPASRTSRSALSDL